MEIILKKWGEYIDITLLGGFAYIEKQPDLHSFFSKENTNINHILQAKGLHMSKK